MILDKGMSSSHHHLGERSTSSTRTVVLPMPRLRLNRAGESEVVRIVVQPFVH